ncbi:MAG: VWA domain-containing protein [Myxococcota bacterium]
MPSLRVSDKNPWHILFLLDDSGSMDGHSADKVNLAMMNMVGELKKLSLGRPPYFRISIIKFGTLVSTVIEHQSEQSISTTDVDTLSGESGTTNAAAAFESAKNLLKKHPGTSNDFEPWVFFISDGVPDDKNAAIHQAARIKALAIPAGSPRIACLGFDNVNDAFMQTVASKPSLYKHLDSVDLLERILPAIGTQLATTSEGAKGAEARFKDVTDV